MAFLTQCGIPFDTAMSLTPEEALGWCVLHGTVKGGEWSWDTMMWVERD